MVAVLANTKERPLLFSGGMVRAVLEGRKTQTRRVVKLPSWSSKDWSDFDTDGKTTETICASTGCSSSILCPYGDSGDRLWVRETWRPVGSISECVSIADVSYRASANEAESSIFTWKPSIFMPRWASRIALEITDVRVERVNEISEEDAIAEGIEKAGEGYKHYRETWRTIQGTSAVNSFATLWNSINGEKYPWQSNPWVWVVRFKVLEQVEQKIG